MMAGLMRLLCATAFFLVSGCVGLAVDSPGSDAGQTPMEVADAGLDAGVPENDAGFDAGIELDAGLDAGVDAGPERVAVFIAVGKQGRRIISCDDGLTWKNDVSFDDAWPADERYRCFSGAFTLPDGGAQSTDCDHNAYSSTSLVTFDGGFLQTMGWGAPGTFFRSADGVSWQQVDMGSNVADVMVGANRLIAATRGSKKSDDLGLTWTRNGDIDVNSAGNTIWNVRGGTAGGGVFLVTAADGANLDFQYSSDDGVTWQRPTMQGGGRVDVCGAGHPAFGNGVFVTMTWAAPMNATVICRSNDGAATWSSSSLPEYVESRPVWTGSEFMAWSGGRMHRSTDGVTWTSTNTRTQLEGVLSGGPNVGPVAVNSRGTFVGVKGGWDVWYEKQRFYRSVDGITWDEMPTGAYQQGHPVTAMVSGMAARSTVCP